MEIQIDIKVPEGYHDPKYGPLYLPPNKNHLILIGQMWCRAIDQIKTDGSFWIYVTKKRENLP